jgi:hypothetical protein
VVITGYEALRGGVYVYSRLSADVSIAYERLVVPWNKTDRCAGMWTARTPLYAASKCIGALGMRRQMSIRSQPANGCTPEGKAV